MYEKRVARALTFGYGFLETAGFPRPSMFSVWIVMGAGCAIITFVRCRLGR